MKRTRKPLPEIVTLSVKTEAEIITKPFMDLHEKWAKKGRMFTPPMPQFLHCDPVYNYGLCLTELDTQRGLKRIFNKLKPSRKELNQLSNEGYDTAYWGRGVTLEAIRRSGRPKNYDQAGWHRWYKKGGDSQYTGLRQNIVLLCAALNGELDD